jgi:hypothetical protein
MTDRKKIYTVSGFIQESFDEQNKWGVWRFSGVFYVTSRQEAIKKARERISGSLLITNIHTFEILEE